MRAPPHAPYRAGAPRFTPSLAPIDPACWLSPDTEVHVLDWKRERLAQPHAVFRQTGPGEVAACEAADTVGAALNAQAPDLIAASALVSDDLVVMEALKGDWACTALTLTAPTFFSIDDAFDNGLAAMHRPVPGGARLAARIGRIFDGLTPGQVLERFNWTIQCGPDRNTPDAAPLRARAAVLSQDEAETELHLRVERQTICKLPKTGAVLFTIRVCLDPLAAIPEQDRAALAGAWRALGRDGRAYKRWDAMEDLVAAVFARWRV